MKNILITGATSGIGKATAEYLDGKGYRCVLLGRNLDKLNNVSEALQNSEIIAYDLKDIFNIKTIFDEIKEKNIVLDGLVHCAGLNPQMKVEDNDTQVMVETFNVNIFSFIEMMKYFQAEGIYNDGASVVAISSVTARCASFKQTIYGSSKAALEETVRCLSKELMQKHIRINCVAPGAVVTDMVRTMFEEKGIPLDSLNKYYPMGAIPPIKVAEMIEMLLSDKSQYMTGSVVEMDAGFWAWK